MIFPPHTLLLIPPDRELRMNMYHINIERSKGITIGDQDISCRAIDRVGQPRKHKGRTIKELTPRLRVQRRDMYRHHIMHRICFTFDELI